MKKIFGFLLIAVCAVSVFSDPPAYTDNVSFEAAIDSAITTCDTVGTTTSQTLMSSWSITQEKGWNYYLSSNTITGANAANAELIIKILAYKNTGTLLGTWVIDTIVGAAAQAFRLPFRYQIMGDYFTLSLTGGAANGAEVITNGFNIVRYRPVNWNK